MPRDDNFWVYIVTNRNRSVLHIGVTSRLSETDKSRDLIRSLPVRSAFRLSVYVAASQPTPFSTALEMAQARILVSLVLRSLPKI